MTPDELKAYRRAWYQANKEKENARTRRWKQRNAKKVKAYRTAYDAKTKEKKADYQRRYRQRPEFKEQQRVYNKRHREKHGERIKAQKRAANAKTNARNRRRNATDPQYIASRRLRQRLYQALRNAGTRKTCRTYDLIGCSPQELQRHLESQFLPGMSWERRGEIHIDHIRPVATFDLSDPEQQRQCFHYTNLRPLWAKDNLRRPKPKRCVTQQSQRSQSHLAA